MKKKKNARLYCFTLSKKPGTHYSGNISLDTSGLAVKSITGRLGAQEAETDVVVPKMLKVIEKPRKMGYY